MKIKTVSKLLFAAFLAIPCMAGGALAGDVLLDPGHSPAQPGAISCTGEKEYVYNDELLKTVASWLDAKNLPADITRMPTQNISLQERAKQSAGKKLFISLHHDSVQPQFMERDSAHPTSQKASGYSIFVSRKNPEFEKSLQYAKILGRALRAGGVKPSSHHGEKISGENRELLDQKLGIYAYDDLVVLKQARCPALLLESAVIVHPEDERRARSAEHMQSVAKAVEKTVRAAAKNS